MAAQKVVKPKKLKEKSLSLEEKRELEANTIKIKATAKAINENDLALIARKKLFLISPEIRSAEFFYLPCWRVVLKFSVSYFKKERADKGQVEFIVDPLKGCGANEEELKIDLITKQVPKDLVADDWKIEQEDAVWKAKVDARWKVLLARYKKPVDELEKPSRRWHQALRQHPHGKRRDD